MVQLGIKAKAQTPKKELVSIVVCIHQHGIQISHNNTCHQQIRYIYKKRDGKMTFTSPFGV